MNQKCKVCGEPAAGFHFGAFTCEGCKSFFGRTYSNVSAIGECKNGGQCVINKKNRTSCKACRLRKCLLVGMSKSGSRYGRRSNWFKIHCLLQEQTGLDAPLGAAGLGGPGTPDLSLLNRMQHGSAGSPDDRSSDVKEEHNKHNMSSSSSVASGRSDSPLDDNDEAAYKENLRLMLTGSPSELPFGLFQRKSSSSPKAAAGLLALAGQPFVPHSSPSFAVDPVRTSSPKSESSRKNLVIPAHQLYHLMTRQRPYPASPPPDFRRHLSSASPVDSIAEQDGPIDLSCKASSTSSLSSSPLGHQSVCHIRAEILADLNDDEHMDDDHPREGDTGVPLDLTTKS